MYALVAVILPQFTREKEQQKMYTIVVSRCLKKT